LYGLILHKKLDLGLCGWGLAFEHKFTSKTLGFYSYGIASNSSANSFKAMEISGELPNNIPSDYKPFYCHLYF
jgi:hypothetical protein